MGSTFTYGIIAFSVLIPLVVFFSLRNSGAFGMTKKKQQQAAQLAQVAQQFGSEPHVLFDIWKDRGENRPPPTHPPY